MAIVGCGYIKGNKCRCDDCFSGSDWMDSIIIKNYDSIKNKMIIDGGNVIEEKDKTEDCCEYIEKKKKELKCEFGRWKD